MTHVLVTSKVTQEFDLSQTSLCQDLLTEDVSDLAGKGK
jgi:hypothetical protein